MGRFAIINENSILTTQAEKYQKEEVISVTQVNTNETQVYDEFKFAFCVKTASKGDLTFYVKYKEDRDILMHEFHNICHEANVDIELMSARQDVMDKIDPIDSFNAWNLSMVCGPLTAEQEAFQNTDRLDQQLNATNEQAQIIEAQPGYVAYIRDGVRCFVSDTLRKELYVTDGDLYKESKTKIKAIKGQYRKVFVSVDYKKQLVRFKECRADENFYEEKDI